MIFILDLSMGNISNKSISFYESEMIEIKC